MARSSQTIRDLNGRFRKGAPTVPGRLMLTHRVQVLIGEHEGESELPPLSGPLHGGHSKPS